VEAAEELPTATATVRMVWVLEESVEVLGGEVKMLKRVIRGFLDWIGLDWLRGGG